MKEEERAAVNLWKLLELGFDLRLKYKDAGITTEDAGKVEISLSAIGRTAKEQGEPLGLSESTKKSFSSITMSFIIQWVNEYMETKVLGDLIPPQVKLIGDRLLVKFPDKKVRIICDESK